jgi:hypothetical protein
LAGGDGLGDGDEIGTLAGAQDSETQRTICRHGAIREADRAEDKPAE